MPLLFKLLISSRLSKHLIPPSGHRKKLQSGCGTDRLKVLRCADRANKLSLNGLTVASKNKGNENQWTSRPNKLSSTTSSSKPQPTASSGPARTGVQLS